MSYGKIVPKVVIGHIALLGLLVLIPLLKDCTWFRKPPVETIQIDLASLPPAPPPPERPDPVEDPQEDVIPVETPIPTPRPRPTATPAPEATSTPRPTATPRPPPTPTPRRSYLTPEEIRRRIENQNQPVAPPPVAPTLSPEEIRDMIGGDLPTRPGGAGLPTSPSGAGVNFGGVAEVLYNKLYSAWVQPRHLSAASGVSAAAEVVVARDGRILSSRFVRRSGVEEFDQSVQSALSSVTTAKPLPSEFEGTSKVFEFEFELSR